MNNGISKFLNPTLEKSVKEPDPLVERANTEKPLTNGSKVKHVGAFLPFRVEGLFFWDWEGGKHRVGDFDWEGGRFAI